jgi:hypothetical protein
LDYCTRLSHQLHRKVTMILLAVGSIYRRGFVRAMVLRHEAHEGPQRNHEGWVVGLVVDNRGVDVERAAWRR